MALTNESNFRNLLREHQAIVRKVARAFTRSNEDREDLTQEILLRVWMSMPSFRAECQVSTWIYRIALNRALTWQRDLKSRPNVLTTEIEVAERQVDWVSDENEMVERMYEAIRTLDDVDRSLILMALDKCTYQEIAEVMGITANCVGVRLSRAKKRLGDLLRTEQ